MKTKFKILLFLSGLAFLFIFFLIFKFLSFDLSYDNIADRNQKNYVGKTVSWKGKIATELSQLDGVKFWIVDGRSMTSDTKYEKWFWVVPEYESNVAETNGLWVSFMLKKYGNLDIKDVDVKNDIFLINGILSESDCDFLSNNNLGQQYCIPNVRVISINKIN
jgi:hypothetical protein